MTAAGSRLGYDRLFGRYWPDGFAFALRLFRKPQIVVFLGPVYVDGTFAHRFEGALHADGTDIDVPQHEGDESGGGHAMDHFSALHGIDRGAIEREHEQISRHCYKRSAENHDPINQLLTSVEAVRRRMFIADDATALFEPLNIGPVRDI